jgi:hypothetical protein
MAEMSYTTTLINVKQVRLLTLLQSILNNTGLPRPTLVFLALLVIPTEARSRFDLNWPGDVPDVYKTLRDAVLECWLPAWGAYYSISSIEPPDWSRLDIAAAKVVFERLNLQFPVIDIDLVRCFQN